MIGLEYKINYLFLHKISHINEAVKKPGTIYYIWIRPRSVLQVCQLCHLDQLFLQSIIIHATLPQSSFSALVSHHYHSAPLNINLFNNSYILGVIFYSYILGIIYECSQNNTKYAFMSSSKTIPTVYRVCAKNFLRRGVRKMGGGV